jgi:hypothetical protein
MPTLETLTELDVRKWMVKGYDKGRRLVNRVRNPTRTGETLSADVKGGYLYQVEVTITDPVVRSKCTCSWSRDCKHVVAVLLKWIQAPHSFTSAQPPTTLSDYPIEVMLVEPPQSHRPKDLPWRFVSSWADRRQAEVQQIGQWLAQVPLRDLRALARKRGWQVKGNSKQIIAGQIAGQMLHAEGVRAAAKGLDAEHQRILCAMLLLGYGYGISPEDIERVAKLWGTLTSHKQFATYMGHLREAGLVVRGHPAGEPYVTQDFVPDAIARHLTPEFTERILACAKRRGGDVVPLPVLANPYPFIRAVNQTALLLEQSPVTLRAPMPRPRLEMTYPALQRWDYDPAEVAAAQQAHRFERHGYSDVTLTVPPPRYSLTDEAIERLAPIAGDNAQLEFIYSLLVTANLFQPGSPVTVWPEVKERFLRLDEMAQRAILAHAYFVMSNWSEVWEALRTGHLHLRRAAGWGRYQPEHLCADLVHFRLAVLRVLACLPDDEWIALDDVVHVLRAILPRFDQTMCVPRYSYSMAGPSGAWFLTEASSDKPLNLSDERNWDMALGNFIRQIVAGPLHWLGLADLGQNRTSSDLIALRLHGLGDLFWDRVEAPPAPHHVAAQAPATQEAGKALATEGLEITVKPSALRAQAHGLLERIARLKSAAPDRFVYQLDAQAVYRSFEAGASLADLADDWERLLPIPMPEAIRAQLAQWWEVYGRIRLYENLTAIELSDDYALSELEASTSLEQHLVAEISPRWVIVNPEAVPTLIAELEKAGYTPKQTEADF